VVHVVNGITECATENYSVVVSQLPYRGATCLITNSMARHTVSTISVESHEVGQDNGRKNCNDNAAALLPVCTSSNEIRT
jgi:hypothetical protein